LLGIFNVLLTNTFFLLVHLVDLFLCLLSAFMIGGAIIIAHLLSLFLPHADLFLNLLGIFNVLLTDTLFFQVHLIDLLLCLLSAFMIGGAIIIAHLLSLFLPHAALFLSLLGIFNVLLTDTLFFKVHLIDLLLSLL